jgi:hypothetical protein
MRVEYHFDLSDVEIPRFSVESSEGAHKLFTLATLALNVLYEQERVDIVFHSVNSQDLPEKIKRFKAILGSAPDVMELKFTEGNSGQVSGTYYTWLSIHSTDDLDED